MDTPTTQPGTQPPTPQQPGTVPASAPPAPPTQPPTSAPGTVPPGQQPGQPAKPADQTQPGQKAKVYTTRQLNAMKEQWRTEVLAELQTAQTQDAESKAREQAAKEGRFEQAYNDEVKAHGTVKEQLKAATARLSTIETWLHGQLDERVQQLPEAVRDRDPKARDEKASVLDRIEWLDDLQATMAALGAPVGAGAGAGPAGQANNNGSRQAVGAGITNGDQADLSKFSLYGQHPGNPQAPQGGGNSRLPTPEEREAQRDKERRRHSFSW